MDNDYLLVLSGHNVFREIELSAQMRSLHIGTLAHCEIRFRPELFFVPFELTASRDDNGWKLSCSETNIYLTTDDVMRVLVLRLEHGTRASVKYADTGVTLFTITFSINFERSSGAYNRVVDLQGLTSLSIGGSPDCNLVLDGPYTTEGCITLTREQQGFLIEDHGTRFGTVVNGRRIETVAHLHDKSFFSLANYFFYYDALQLRCSQDARITFVGVEYRDDEPRCETSTYPLFVRNSRIKSVMDDEAIPILDPPSPPSPPHGNIVVQLIPALLMLAMTVGMRYYTSGTDNLVYLFMSVGMMGVGILTSVFGIVSERKNYRRAVETRISRYERYIEQKRSEIEGYRDEELEVLEKTYPSLETELQRTRRFSGDLFDRTPTDDDFLDIRLGTGARRSVKQVDFKPRERFDVDNLTVLPQQVYEEYRSIKNAPVSVSLRKNGSIGIVGDDHQLHSLLKTIIVDIVTRHFPTDVKLFLIVSEKDESLVHWARNLPHIQNEELNRRNIVCDDESRNVIFEYLFKTLSERAELGRDVSFTPHYVVFVVDEYGLKTHPLSQFITGAESIGTTFLFFENHKECLPIGCRRIVTLFDKAPEGRIVDTENDRHAGHFTYDIVDDLATQMVAQTLAPVYSEEVSLEGSLTTSYSLFEMLGIITPEDLDLARRWQSSVVYRSLAAPIGLSKSGMVYLDLSDRADGPHGLVAGTTGSGKSETLLTYLISLATLFHPHEVGFMIIDFKGGGMANQLRDLPHLVGTITNIDGREIERSLKSIRAELQKRQRLFAEADVNHIDAYIRKYKSGTAHMPLPHLIIVVDEFAELKADQPEFMAELISTARIGRSLGVHLILATQKPAGQVNEQIWSNSRFKLCLKVQSREDSNEVLKSPLAAEIKEPGRAYLQVGNNEKFELFQSAYGGGPEHEDDGDVHEFEIYAVENSGKRKPLYSKRRKQSDELRTTQLEAVTARIQEHCIQADVHALPSICLPSLPDLIPYQTQNRVPGDLFALGTYDDPDTQFQGAATFDLDNANTFVLGSSQTGKTNLLQVVIRSIAESTSPAQSVIYIMDFASMILKNFERLNHVGGVVISSEDEKLKNLFKLLSAEVVQRKSRLLSVGVSSFVAYREAGYTDLPHIYVLMDNYAVFRELYMESYEDDLLSLCRDGVTYGISFIITNATTSGFGYKYLSNFSNHLAFSCNDTAEYGVLFERSRLAPKNVAGRTLCVLDSNVYEMQTYLSFEGEKEFDRVQAMRAFVRSTNMRYGDLRARRIPNVPDDLDSTYLRDNYQIELDYIALGLSYETVEPVGIDLARQTEFALVGDGDGARDNLLKTLIDDVEYHIFDRSVELYIADNLQGSLQMFAHKPYVVDYSRDASSFETTLSILQSVFEERLLRAQQDGLTSLLHDSYVLVIINSADALRQVTESSEATALYQRIVSQGEGLRFVFVLSCIANEQLTYTAPQIMRNVRDSRNAIVFANMADIKFFDVSGIQARIYRAPLEPGQAFVTIGSEYEKIRYAINETSQEG